MGGAHVAPPSVAPARPRWIWLPTRSTRCSPTRRISGNVQYGELMDFCYVWLRGLPSARTRRASTGIDPLSGGTDRQRDPGARPGALHRRYRLGLLPHHGCRPEARRTAPRSQFHHNAMEPYHANSASPSSTPASSVRHPSPVRPRWEGPFTSTEQLHPSSTRSSSVVSTARLVAAFCSRISTVCPPWFTRTWVNCAPPAWCPTAGDVRCIVFGHLTRMAVWRLRHDWDSTQPTSERLDRVGSETAAFGDPKRLIETLAIAAVSPGRHPRTIRPLFPDDRTQSFDAVSF